MSKQATSTATKSVEKPSGLKKMFTCDHKELPTVTTKQEAPKHAITPKNSVASQNSIDLSTIHHKSSTGGITKDLSPPKSGAKKTSSSPNRPVSQSMVHCEEKMGGMKLEKADSRESAQLSKAKEYPDSEDEYAKPLQYGTISNHQAENLEKFYHQNDRFPTAQASKKFTEKYNLTMMDVEIWLETRRERTYRDFVRQGLETEPSVMKFYCEALKTAEGVRLEQPMIRSKSFFSHEGANQVEAKREEEEKLQPLLTISSNKLYMSPKKEEKCTLMVKNGGEVKLVYQISMVNSENYLLSPICAILHPGEELTLNITRKPSPIDNEEFFRIDYGLNPDGVIDAKVSADRGDLIYREIVEIVAIDEKEMKVAR